MMELINKVKSLERETAKMRSGCNIVEAVTASNKELTKLWTNMNKRERVEKEVPEDPVMEDLLTDGQATMDDNHKTFAWELRRMVKQPTGQRPSKRQRLDQISGKLCT